MALLVPQISSESLSHLLWGSDLLKEEFKKWFNSILKWKSPLRVQKGYELFPPIAEKNLSELIAFLEGFAQNKILCWFTHEIPGKVIVLLDEWTKPLTSSNCPIRFNNPACGHPEITWLAQAVFIAEKVIWHFLYRRWLPLLNMIIIEDTHIWSSFDIGIYVNKLLLLKKQEEISWKIQWYIRELVEKLREEQREI